MNTGENFEAIITIFDNRYFTFKINLTGQNEKNDWLSLSYVNIIMIEKW